MPGASGRTSVPGASGRTTVPGTSGRTAVPGASGRIQAFGGLSSLPQGLFLTKMCVSGFLDLHLVRFCQIWSDLVRFNHPLPEGCNH